MVCLGSGERYIQASDGFGFWAPSKEGILWNPLKSTPGVLKAIFKLTVYYSLILFIIIIPNIYDI